MTTDTQPELERYTLTEGSTPEIDFDGKRFKLRSPDDYALPEVKRQTKMWREVLELDSKDTITAKEAKTYEDNLNALVKYACPDIAADEEVYPKLKRSHKQSIVVAFFFEAAQSHPLLRKTATALAEQLQDSSDFMVAQSTNGSGLQSETSAS